MDDWGLGEGVQVTLSAWNVYSDGFGMREEEMLNIFDAIVLSALHPSFILVVMPYEIEQTTYATTLLRCYRTRLMVIAVIVFRVGWGGSRRLRPAAGLPSSPGPAFSRARAG